jgi:hypothetical protein
MAVSARPGLVSSTRKSTSFGMLDPTLANEADCKSAVLDLMRRVFFSTGLEAHRTGPLAAEGVFRPTEGLRRLHDRWRG